MKEISKLENYSFNNDGNIILNEKKDGGGITQEIKYGLIKLIGEKQERRVSMKTILDINKAKEANFNGQINIPELNMSVNISQIIMMRSDIENVRIQDNIINLPTVDVYLDLDFKILPHTRLWFLKNQIPHYEATVHYIEVNGERQYYLDFDKIKKLLKIDFDDAGYQHIIEVYEYGVLKIGVQNA